jgi:hypothetical protein
MKTPVSTPGAANTQSWSTAATRDQFYLWISVALVIVVALGFLPTINPKLLHPALPLPSILYIHAAVFSLWVLLFITQSTLIAQRKVLLHRRLGKFAAILGGSIPIVGVMTAVAMTQFNLDRGHATAASERALIIPFFDMLAFSTTFALALYWRSKPEFHRRLMFIATCGLTAAAFARFPSWLVRQNSFYVGGDALIFAGVARDWIRPHAIHAVYRYGLPALVVGQAITMWIFLGKWPAWSALAHSIVAFSQ